MTSRGAVACDVDGVVWLSGEPLPGAAEGIEVLRSAGFDVWFVTNSSALTHEILTRRFGEAGIESLDRFVTAADAAAGMVRESDSVLVGGEEGVIQALRSRGCDVVPVSGAVSGSDRAWFDAVVVGIDRSFDYHSLEILSRHIRAGSRFIATNDDPTYPSPSGLQPGGGAIVAAVAAASGRMPQIAGKPYAAMIDAVRSRLGGASPSWVIGDRGSTDGRFAVALGSRFAHVLSDVQEDPGDGATLSVANLLDAARMIVASE